MREGFKVVLVPFEVQQRVGNMMVTKSLQQDKVIIETEKGQQHWGYCPHIGGTFLPLSGFPKELVGEVQRQINELRGFKAGEGPKPPEIIDQGPTAQEQEAEQSDEDESEFYE